MYKDEVKYFCSDCNQDVVIDHACEGSEGESSDWEANVAALVKRAADWDEPDQVNYGLERLLEYIVELTQESYARGFVRGKQS